MGSVPSLSLVLWFLTVSCHIEISWGLTSLTHAFHPRVLAFKSQSLAFTSISFRDLPRLYDIIGGSL